jgi:hypothetical protein
MEKLKIAFLAAVFAALAGCSSMQLGGGKTAATGAAAGETAQNANSQLERCDAALGTLAVVEDTRASWYRTLTTDRKLGPTTPVLKLSGVGGGYSNTAEGKVIVAAFTDSYNNLVKAVRNYKAQDVKGGLGKGGRLEVK